MAIEKIKNQKPLVVAITGASGSIYGLRFVKAVTELGQPITLTLSAAAGLVIKEELGIDVDVRESAPLARLFDANACDLISYYPEHELAAPIASGSYPTRGMVIIPASTSCFAKIANGISDSLIERAAECAVKEGRKLVVVPRETPLSAIHLENLLKLARLGVSVVPAVPAFYSGAQTVDELVDFVIGKVLDQLEIPHSLYRRWTGPEYFLSLQNRSGGGNK
ncbi:MAG: UbiX family flavin prenyltransferase [Candidatus Omnitrophica bacterium]|nr:UbiX family flavin prenyltransferase [Candidatus Omnitrophota bacterium]